MVGFKLLHNQQPLYDLNQVKILRDPLIKAFQKFNFIPIYIVQTHLSKFTTFFYILTYKIRLWVSIIMNTL